MNIVHLLNLLAVAMMASSSSSRPQLPRQRRVIKNLDKLPDNVPFELMLTESIEDLHNITYNAKLHIVPEEDSSNE